MVELNKEIQEQEREEFLRKRQQNNYDLIGLGKQTHPAYAKIHRLLKTFHANAIKKGDKRFAGKSEVSLKDAEPQTYYAENVKIYANKALRSAYLVVYDGIVYFMLVQEQVSQINYSFFIEPFSLLDDLDRIIYSDTHEHYLAMRISDIRKVNGVRDHIVFETCDRELLADFVMDYADKKATAPVNEGGNPDAEIIFE